MPSFESLNKAFADLNKRKIFAKQDFCCCQTCGASECNQEIGLNKNLVGYCFYHDQDTESAIKTGKLWLAYGNKEDGKYSDEKIGQMIVRIFKKNGFKTDWSGDSSQRIVVYLTKAIRKELEELKKLEHARMKEEYDLTDSDEDSDESDESDDDSN